MKKFGNSNAGMARFARAILNHAPTGEYRQRFFPEEPTACRWCDKLQTRSHILCKCEHYQRRWRFNAIEEFLRGLDPFAMLVDFLERNPTAFTFADAPE